MSLYPSVDIRKRLLAGLRETFDVFPELDGIPTDYAAMLVDPEKLHPEALFNALYHPFLSKLLDEAYSAVTSLSSDDLRSRLPRAQFVTDPENIPYEKPVDAFDVLCNFARNVMHENSRVLGPADAYCNVPAECRELYNSMVDTADDCSKAVVNFESFCKSHLPEENYSVLFFRNLDRAVVGWIPMSLAVGAYATAQSATVDYSRGSVVERLGMVLDIFGTAVEELEQLSLNPSIVAFEKGGQK